mgnify:CR=1 FL=1
MGISKDEFRALDHRVTALDGRLQLVREGMGSIATGVAQNLASIQANLSNNGDALEQFDIFNQIWSKMFMRIIERQEQTAYLHATGKLEIDLFESDREVIRTKAREWFDLTFQNLKDIVKEERDAYIKELRARVQAEHEKAQQEAEQAKKEGEVAEEALRGAEQSLSASGGQGSEIPAGVETFGG